MTKSTTRIKIFISHNEKDVAIAKALIEYLEAVFPLNEGDIRCTSVPGYKIPAGVNIVEQLKKDLKAGIGFFAILSHFGLESHWVTNELGAAWRSERFIVPILGPKLKVSDKRLAAIGAITVLKIDDHDVGESMRQYIKELGDELGMEPRLNTQASSKLKKFITKFRTYGGAKANFSETDVIITSPKPGGILHDTTSVTFEVAGRPRNGYLWIGILIDNTFYPKGPLNDLIKSGKGKTEVKEGGNNKSDKQICIIGVGAAGNYQLQIERDREDAEKDWSGLELDEIIGYKKFPTVDKLKRKS